MSNPRCWALQPSGRRLDLTNPSPDGFTDSDLAEGLTLTYRWGAQSKWKRPMTVAQHSLLVLAIMEMISPVPLSAMQKLRELTHDGEEGLIRYDPLSPLKHSLGDPFRALLKRLADAVFEHFDLPHWTPEEHKLHKVADHLAAASEAVHVAGWSRTEVSEVLEIEATPMDEDPLVAIYGGVPWEPWPARVAMKRFMAKLNELQRQRDLMAA